MAEITISEQQLKTWASHVQLRKNKDTYEKVEDIFRFNDFEIYLQGSVANNTNIWADGDIDIVLQFNGVFGNNAKQKLSDNDYLKFSNKYHDATYTQDNLRNDIKAILEERNISYKEKSKCIELHIGGQESNYQNVDLVPCFQYRNHWGQESDEYHEGIKIETRNGKTIINYPKLHKANGENKNGKTNKYKKVVRIFKNIKKKLVDDDYYFDGKKAPSYFIECLLYNVPNEKFNKNNFTNILANCINWITKNDFQNIQNLKCQNEITDLFGDDNTQWDLDNCKYFINKVKKYLIK